MTIVTATSVALNVVSGSVIETLTTSPSNNPCNESVASVVMLPTLETLIAFIVAIGASGIVIISTSPSPINDAIIAALLV